MGRIVLGVVAALVLAIVGQGIANLLTNLIFPAPPVANPLDRGAVGAAFALRSTGTIALTSISYFVGAFVGGWAGAAIARRRSIAWVAAGVMLLFGLVVILSFPNPGWATALTLAGPIAAALIVRHFLPDDPEPLSGHDAGGGGGPERPSGVSLTKESDHGPL